MPGRPQLKTTKDRQASEVISALQKCIRRGMTDDALYWAAELEESGFGAWMWKRIRIITSEDVGPAWPEGPAVIEALHKTYLELKKRGDDKQRPWRLQIVHAVVLLCRAPKSRIVDWALIHHWGGLAPDRDIPDVALDKHTARGKHLRRGWDHFFEEGTLLEPHEPDEEEIKYRELAYDAVTGMASDRPRRPIQVASRPSSTSTPSDSRREHAERRRLGHRR